MQHPKFEETFFLFFSFIPNTQLQYHKRPQEILILLFRFILAYNHLVEGIVSFEIT